MDESALLALDRLAVESLDTIDRMRFAGDLLANTAGRPFVGLVGPRGSGKTTLLRQIREKRDDSLYLSADTLQRETNLFDLVRRFHEGYGIGRFYIDEIHAFDNYPQHLKQIYDFLPVGVWFTSSVSLSLTAAGWDLSRRVDRHTLLPFSYREYLWFVGEVKAEQLQLEPCLTMPIPSSYMRRRGRFDEYVRGGLHPFMLEQGSTVNQFSNVLDKVITQDIPRFDRQLRVEDIDKLHKTVEFIGRSPVDGINYSSVSANVGVTKYKAEKYLDYLERSFVLTRVFPLGTNVLKEPKVLLQLPYRLIYQSYGDALGALREEFFATAMHQHHRTFSYAKSTRGAKTPDFVTDLAGKRVVLEIGGRRKGRAQFKGLDYDYQVILYDGDFAGAQPGERVPLFCLGFA